MIEYLDHKGELDCMPYEELESVERSGRSSWQVYAMQPGDWPNQCTPIAPLMDARPGQTTEGEFPAHLPVIESPTAKTFDEMQKGGIHWKVNSRSACDNVVRPGGMFVGPQFARARASARRCEACADLYRTLVREGMKWSGDDVRTLRRMWKDYEQREECARLLRRTFYSCLMKWGMIR